jgi:hypothetical protein
MENELYPGHAEEQRKREELTARIERAHSTVLPGALRAAFGGDITAKAGPNDEFTLQPVTLGLAANLERIKSPLLDVVRVVREVFSRKSENEGQKPEDAQARLDLVKQKISELEFEEEQIAETVFVFINSPKRVRQLLEKGAHAFREAAMEEIGDKLHPTQMAALQRACSQHYVASFATIIGYGVPPTESKGDEVSFPPPSPSAATGSVGG